MSCIMHERDEHPPLEVATDPEAFADTYAELCGVISIDELVRLYGDVFPDFAMDHPTMRRAAAGRAASWDATCRTWRHEGVEYALAEGLSNAGWEEGSRGLPPLGTEASGAGAPGPSAPPGLLLAEAGMGSSRRRLRARRETLAALHAGLPVRRLTFDELVMGKKRIVEGLPSVQCLRGALVALAVSARGHTADEGPRHRAARLAERAGHLLSTQVPRDGEAVDVARALAAALLGPGHELDADGNPWDQRLLVSTRALCDEVPRWDLNGWSVRAVREGAARPRLPPREVRPVRERAYS